MSGLFDESHPVVRAAEPLLEVSGLSPRLRLGTSSWSFPGWRGTVYRDETTAAVLSREGLRAYAKHPLLRAVGVDRSYYAPVLVADYRRYAAQVPDDFRFLVKASARVTQPRHPAHRSQGEQAGQVNRHFLDLELLGRELAAARQGLGHKLGMFLLQLPPQPAGHFTDLPQRLASVFERLSGPMAVEPRTPALLTAAYADVLVGHGVRHCYTVHASMPPIRVQVRQVPGGARHSLLVRWMLPPGLRYAEAKERFAPFSALVTPDPAARADIAHLVRLALERDKEVMVIANNKAEGCSPASLAALAATL